MYALTAPLLARAMSAGDSVRLEEIPTSFPNVMEFVISGAPLDTYCAEQPPLSITKSAL
jgi:hypothetical protein